MKKYIKVYFIGLVSLLLLATNLFSLPFSLAQEANVNQNVNQDVRATGTTSPNYQLDSSVISPTGDLLNSSNYQMISTFGETGAETYESANYQIQIGFPATFSEKKKPKLPEIIEKILQPIIEIPEVATNLAEEIAEVINKQIDKVVARLPEPVKRNIVATSKAINTVVNNVRSNKQLVTVVDEVAEPTVVTAVAVSAVAVATTSSAALELTNITYLLFRFGYFWLLPLSIGKKRKPWGVVFDSTTGRPIKGAIVRIFTREFDKLKESQITDVSGRFGFLVDIGDYYVVVQKPGYVFPSSLITTAVISQYHYIYRGEIINVKEKREGILNINIPIDPERGHVSEKRILWLRVLNFLGLILERINIPLLLAGTILSWIILIIEPKSSNYIILLLYAILLSLKVFLFRRIRRSWGQVLEEETNKPIEQTLVRVFNFQVGALVATRVTNKNGQFTALVNPGEYYLVATKPGYLIHQSQPLKIVKEKGAFRMTIKLKKQTVTQPVGSSVSTPSTSGTFSPESSSDIKK